MSTQSAFHSSYIKNNGDVYTFGYNSHGQLGFSSSSVYPTQTKSTSLSNVKMVAEGYYHTAVLLMNGDLYTFGYGYYGQLGDTRGWRNGNANYTPVKVMSDVKEVTCGYLHTVALKNNGDVYTFGYNAHGELGNGGTSDTYTPQKVATDIRRIGAGYTHSFIIDQQNKLYATGYNGYGGLGINNGSNKLSFTFVMDDVRQVDGGIYHSLFLKTDGSVWGTGYNYYGQTGRSLGNGTNNFYGVPHKIMDNCRSVVCGGYFSGVITNDSKLYTFGYDDYGQLGMGYVSGNINYTPRLATTNVKQVAMGYYHTLVLDNDGKVRGVGYNYYGMLGVATNNNSSTGVVSWQNVASDVRRLMGGGQISFTFSDSSITPSFHKEDCQLVTTIGHVGNDLVSYRVLVNGEQKFPSSGWTSSQLTDFILTKDLSHTYFNLGSNTVMLEVQDSQGHTDSIAWTTTKTNNPPVASPELSAAQIHKDNVMIGGTLSDPEGDRVQYRVLLNNVQKYPIAGFTELTPPPVDIGLVINNADFNVGANTLKIEVQDDLGSLTTWTQIIIKTNTAPSITGTVLGNFINAEVTDPDSDKVQYRILLNGSQLYPENGYTGYNPVPLTIQYVIPKTKVNKGKNNTVRIETLDELGGSKSRDMIFMGMYSGLLFCDAAESFYSDDFGDVLKYLDFGTMVAGQTTAAERVYVKNTLGYPVENVRLWVDQRELDGVNAKAEISKLDAPFEPRTQLVYVEQLEHNAKISFYVRIATNRQAMWGGMFDILVKADPGKS
ncbi:RCC1 domain-containing protein [Paenibacillus sp. TSA_86.1]|uniref:RCC1 domain-containing protein n=1 Tax=Paenibacillus sp. TSA_86.1 TaxID=3415649 RepID=UPI0040460357